MWGKKITHMNTTENDTTPQRHPILFVGAGPGDPDLITVKGQSAMALADTILYAGSLVPEAVLKWAGPDAKKLSSASLNLEDITNIMASDWQAGRRVVRLHTGDPSLYGAIDEQMIELEKRQIPYAVIPGVSAAFAAAAAMGIEYTLPEVTQTLILTRMAGRTPAPDMESLESLARHGASMAIYLSMGQIQAVQDILSRAYGPDMSCAIAFRVSHPDEKIIRIQVKDLAKTAEQAKLTRHALIIVGKALSDRSDAAGPRSRLYDRKFTHGYRQGGD